MGCGSRISIQNIAHAYQLTLILQQGVVDRGLEVVAFDEPFMLIDEGFLFLEPCLGTGVNCRHFVLGLSFLVYEKIIRPIDLFTSTI